MREVRRRLWSAVSILLAMAVVNASAIQVTINPGDDIQTAVNANPTGTIFNVKAGLYRGQSITPKDWDVFIGEAGTILNGSILLTNFVQQGNLWVTMASVPQGQVFSVNDCGVDPGWDGTRHPDDLFYNDVALHHVLSQGEVATGKWYVDYDQGKIYVADDPAGKKVEISVTRNAFSGSATNVTVQGLVVEKYAIPAQFGAIGDQYPGANWLVQGNETRLNHGTGITGGNGWIILGNYTHHNGGFGITCAWWALDKPCTGLIIDGNEMSFNNTLHFDVLWGAGGAKVCEVDGMICRNNYSHDNRGDGLWDDVYSLNVMYEGNMVISNYSIGISHEIGYTATMRNNYASGNGSQQLGWLMDAQLLIQNAQSTEVYSNTVVVASGFGNGISIVNQDSRPESQPGGGAPHGICVSQNNYVHNNNVMYTSAQGLTGAACDNDSFWTIRTNRFDYDSYTVPDTAVAHWDWSDGPRDFATFQSYGQELHGTLNAPIATRIIGLSGNLNFGFVTPGTTATATLTISSSGNTAFIVTGINCPPGFSSTPQWGIVPAGGAMSVTVTFAPTASTNYAGTITVATDASSGGNTIAVSGGTATLPLQSPYGGSATSLPGQIEAEDYDNGGEGVAYHDSDVANNGDATIRNDSVDIKNAGSGNYVIGWNQPGEWQEYTVNVPNGAYNISSLVATVNTDAQQRVLLGDGPEGSNFVVLGVMNVPNTGSYDTFQQGVLSNVAITNGGNGRVMRLETLGNYFNVDWIRFDSVPGSLSGSGVAGGSSTVNLTAEGTDDWAHWGLNGTNLDHKAVSGSAVNHITETHVGSLMQYTDNASAYSWTDGTPTTNAAATATGIYIGGTGNSFTITVPADTASRTLKVYVGGWMSSGTLTAHLSDGSAVDYTDSLFSNNVASYYAVYTLTYKAGAANQNMTVRWQMAGGAGGGNVTLQAVTLQVDAAEVIRILRIGVSQGSPPGLWFNWCGSDSETNSFRVYRCTNLTSGTWELLDPNVARSGTGTNTWRDTNVFQQAFYRVATPNQ